MEVKNVLHADGNHGEDIESKDAGAQNEENKFTLHISNFSYRPFRKIGKEFWLYLKSLAIKYNIQFLFPYMQGFAPHQDLVLHRMNFALRGGELTVLLGMEDECRELIHLIAGRTKMGHFDGDILLSGPGITGSSYYHDQVAFVPSKPLYIPGLTYLEMLRFSVELKVMPQQGKSTALLVEERVQELLQIMNLTKCKNRVIPQYPPLRGEEGSDLRRLSIALEIARLPPVIVVHDPTLNLGPAFSLTIMQSLKALAAKGHIVICSQSKIAPAGMDLVDRLVLLSEGYSIFSNSPKKAQAFFTSPAMGYEYKKGTVLCDFLMDISTGVERPTLQREADLPVIMQEKYETSDYFVHYTAKNGTSAFSPDFFKLYGYGKFDPPLYALYRITTNIKRAVYTKFRDFDQIRASLGACTIVGLVCGYLQFDQGHYGNFALSLVGLPYANTANLAGLSFFITAFAWAFPFLSMHVVCQKLQLYRYELASRCTTTFAFVAGALISEIPFTIVYINVFANLIYWMTDMAKGADNYWFFIQILTLQAINGLVASYLFGAIFRKELLARDMFFLTVTFVALISGFPFQLTTMAGFFGSASVVNPWRWCFESIMAYKFQPYEDGSAWLKPYSFVSFDHYFGKQIAANFLLITGSVILIFLLKEPLLLFRQSAGTSKNYRMSQSRDSTGSVEGDLPVAEEFTRRSTRQSELVKPIVFMRESSVTGRASKLSVNVSQMGEDNMDRGPTVIFKDVSFRVRDQSPSGFKQILQRVSGKFDWGKLSMIMGAPKSGKTSLLHILAGDIAIGAEVTGKIMLNNREPPANQPLWQRCGFVPAEDLHYRDLTVKQVLEYGMALRCNKVEGLKHIQENVTSTVEILHLEDCLNKKTKSLTPGELKRLSIAEEMVAGPKLLLMDEPCTGVNIFEVVVLLQTFREMVNQDRTVVASVHQPSAEEFKLFDSLLLLSKGRVIYHGPVQNATNFFVQSPFAFDARHYTNPADFITDISGSFISDAKGDFIDAVVLENQYQQSENYNRLQTQIRNAFQKAATTSATTAASAIGNGGSSVPRNSEFDGENPMNIYSGKSVQRTVVHETSIDRPSYTSDSGMNAGHSIEIENASAGMGNNNTVVPKKKDSYAYLVFKAVIDDTFAYPTWANLSNIGFKGAILVHRTFFALVQRYELLISSQLVHIFLAVLFGTIMGDSSGTDGLYNTLSFLAVSAMFLMIANVTFVFYMFNSSQVFLKEYTRGLYSNFLRWITSDYPLYILRMINAIVFITIAWGMTNQPTDADTFGFAILDYMFFILASVILAEAIIVGAADKRTAYTTIPGVAFLNFLLSGLFIKPQSLPQWMAPWAPSVSMIRWTFQANFLNLYEGTDVFKSLPTGYSTYTAFLRLFGWGGKTRWYCFYMVLANIAVFKFFGLWAGALTAVRRRGGKQAPDQE